MNTNPSAGALRAAMSINKHFEDTHGIQLSRTLLAEIIDRESGLAGLFNACRDMIAPLSQDEIDECPQYKAAQLAIIKVLKP